MFWVFVKTFTVVDVFSLLAKTKTVYPPPAKESVLKDLPDGTGKA